MTTAAIPRPRADEFKAYYGKYIERVPNGDLLPILEQQIAGTTAMIRGLSEAQGNHRYAPEKWSIKEVIGHVIDSERIFAYRALRIARGDATPLPGFEQDDYVPTGGFDRRTLRDLADELAAVRQATIHLFRHLDDEALQRRGTASDHTITPRALAYIIAGHELHHVNILRTKYL